jgi:rod shape determining protein RodA
LYTNPHGERPFRFDWLQLLAVAGLMLISIAFVYSATSVNKTGIEPVWYHQSYFRQIVWFALGTIAAGAICMADYHTLTRWSLVAYCVTILFLIVVIIPHIGSKRYGAMRWIDLGGFQFQPSEFAKLAFILAEAHFLSRPVDELRLRKNFWKSLGMMALPFLLILKEPDLGSALVLLPTGLAMLYAAGAPQRYLTQILGIGGIATALIVADVVYAPARYRIKFPAYQTTRLLVYFGRDYADYYSAQAANERDRRALREEELKDSYNVTQSLIAVGSGGFTGRGWRQGLQNGLGFLPEAGKHNDFIFSVIAEEKGFVGSVAVLTLYSVILFTGIRIAGQARDRLGKLLAVGVVTLIFSHVFINIGMTIRIMPVTGVPLPLLSYGGSSVLGSMIAIGLLQNVYMYRKAY